MSINRKGPLAPHGKSKGRRIKARQKWRTIERWTFNAIKIEKMGFEGSKSLECDKFEYKDPHFQANYRK